MHRGRDKNTRPAYTFSSSIPVTYQQLVIPKLEKKGFSSQARRFPPQICLDENPGPGSYGCMSNAEVASPSFSKKGTTGFVASKAPRFSSNPKRGIPGPDAYSLQRSLINKHDFSVGVSRVFRSPVAAQLDESKHNTPAPNQYDLGCGSRERFSSVVGTSAFLSRTRRDSFVPKKNVPSPCHYEVNNVIQLGSKTIVAPFKSKTQRIPAPVDHRVPGPGAYSPHKTPPPAKRTILPRGYYLALAAPAMIVSKDPPLPGPGQYNIGNSISPSKRPVPTAAFASRTERTLQTSHDDIQPGPGFYNPHILPKQSFLYNDSRIWVPV